MAEYKINLEGGSSAVVENKDAALEFLREVRQAQGIETAAVFKREDENSGWNTVFVHLPTAHAEVLLLTD